MTDTIKASVAMLRVIESYGVDHLYGLPGGSFSTTMDALYDEQAKLKFIQVKHEEVGAMAATADAKLTGKIGVAFGSAGPGATHLFNGLYDAKMDGVPMLALIGQVKQSAMNFDSFQEMDEVPMFGDVSVYNRTVTTAESLPHVIDEAIRIAYQQHGVATVVIPNDLGAKLIPDTPYSSAESYREPTATMAPNEEDVLAALNLIKSAKRPVLFVGMGAKNAPDEVIALAKRLSMPIITTAIAKGVLPDDTEMHLGSANRVAQKPANDALKEADLVVMIGSNWPFAVGNLLPEQKFIQIDNDSSKFGRRHHVDVGILADAKAVIERLLALTKDSEPTAWYNANLANIKNWRAYLTMMMNRTDADGPLGVEPVFKEINRISTADAVYGIDVGDINMNSVRYLNMTGEQKWVTSGLFATMGYGVPAALAGKLSFPDRQVFNLAGDGAFSMVMQDIDTEVRNNLQIINVIFTNRQLGFIVDEQEDAQQPRFGVYMTDNDYAKIAEAQGAIGITVTKQSELAAAFDRARDADKPVLIDVKVTADRPIPVEALQLDPAKFSAEEIATFKERYHADDLVPFSAFLTEYGVAEK
ncbi:pyruvate oxidase [Periweissella cryptocerci]|uniref:Pyruvate oxidase n=1 Tax=Periweissella cryptocerci TaxID=2506420 RepID=A0A4P6YWL8_9LACO|nr:pyruvate oxidase [Periweissella cryptocerci]QBO37224.1 pyruvate oxidase [Periweissella cryptocerci]